MSEDIPVSMNSLSKRVTKSSRLCSQYSLVNANGKASQSSTAIVNCLHGSTLRGRDEDS